MKISWKLASFLLALVAIVAPIVTCKPEWLADNTFLDKFVSHELIAVLVIILTVKFVAVAQAHGIINDIVDTLVAKGKYALCEPRIDKIRYEVDSNAWLIFGAFFACFGALIIKGAFGGNVYVCASVHGFSLIVFLLNGFIFYDIYNATFALMDLKVYTSNLKKEDQTEDSDSSTES